MNVEIRTLKIRMNTEKCTSHLVD